MATKHPLPPYPPAAPTVELGEPKSVPLTPDETRFVVQPLIGPGTYLFASSTETLLWIWRDEAWHDSPAIGAEEVCLDLDPGDFVAARPLHESGVLEVSPVPAPRLRVDRLFDGVDGTCTRAPGPPVPASEFDILLTITGARENTAVPCSLPDVRFIPAGAEIGLPVPVLCPTDPFGAAGVDAGARGSFRLCIPEAAEAATGRLQISWGSFFLDGIDFEISDPTTAATRTDLAATARALASSELGEHAALVGGHRPLPVGARLCEGLTGRLLGDVGEADTYLFYAFEPGTRFEQERTLWIAARVGMEPVLVESSLWPDVVIPDPCVEEDGVMCVGDRVGIDYGSPDTRRNQLFAVGPPLALLEVGDPPVAVPKRAPRSPLSGEPFLAPPRPGCPRTRKVAVLVQLDDNTAPRNQNGRLIPNFDDVMQRERDLVRALGFDQVIELKPDDFIVGYTPGGRPRFNRPNSSRANSLQPLLDRIDKVVSGITDCCTEIVIFINAHQSRAGYLRYKNKDVPRSNDATKSSDVSGSISQAFLSRLIARQIQTSTKAGAVTCQPRAEIIFHTCFSGKFANSAFDDANKAGVGLTASSGNETTKAKPRGGAATTDEYFFLDALEECATANPGQTLDDLFPCIRAATRRRSGNTQTPRRKPPRDP